MSIGRTVACGGSGGRNATCRIRGVESSSGSRGVKGDCGGGDVDAAGVEVHHEGPINSLSPFQPTN